MRCEICLREFSPNGLAAHIENSHKEINVKDYYDKYLRKENEGKCKICGKPTRFKGFRGYSKYCSMKCVWHDKDIVKKRNSHTDFDKASKKASFVKFAKYGSGISESERYRRIERSKANLSRILSENHCELIDIVLKNGKIYSVKYRCSICNSEYTRVRSGIDRNYRDGKGGFCPNCSPKYSNPEGEIYNYIKSIYSGSIIMHDRKCLAGHELDIFIPDVNIAIEYDSFHFHDENHVTKFYHIEKTEACLAKNIKLIHIFEDEWRDRKDIVKSRLSGFFHKNKVIYARKTEFRVVSHQNAKEFLIENHIQGYCISKIRYGLYLKDELVALMTFGKSRFSDEFEMLRFCNKKYTNVVGGASKLIKHAGLSFVTYADRRWSNGDLYRKLGMKFLGKTEPNYHYIVKHRLESRFKYQKHKLILAGFDPNLSEHDIMKKLEIFRIYDSGMLKFSYNS
jgi:hypothetical protein